MKAGARTPASPAAWAVSLAIPLLTYVAYRNGLDNAFIESWDTGAYIARNPHIQALNWENIAWMFTSFHIANWHPLTWLSHAVDFSLFGLEPRGHHLVSLVIHCLNSVLLFHLLLSLQDVARRRMAPAASAVVPSARRYLLAGLAALAFGVHPQHVESVVWVAERKDVLCLLFSLLTLQFYLNARMATVAGRQRRFLLAALLSFALALMSKPMAVTLPVVLLLLDVCPLYRSRLTGSADYTVPLFRLLLEKLPFFLLTVLSIIVTLLAQQHGGAIASLDVVSIEDRLLNACSSIMLYISKFLLPIGLSPIYPYPTYETLSDYYPGLLALAAILLITTLCVVFWRRGQHQYLVGWLAYLVTLSPVLGIIQVGNQAAADRYAYFPTIPFYLLTSYWIVHAFSSPRSGPALKTLILTATMAWLGILVHLTDRQTDVWANDRAFWSAVLQRTPHNPLAHFHVGNLRMEDGDVPAAIAHYETAMRLGPHRKWYYGSRLPVAYIQAHQLDKALEFLTGVIAADAVESDIDEVRYMIGWIHYRRRNMEEARRSLQQAIRLNPNHRRARRLLSAIADGRQDAPLILRRPR